MCQQLLGGVEMLLHMLGISKKLVHGTLLGAGMFAPPTMAANLCNPGGCLIVLYVSMYHVIYSTKTKL